ncbi:MAG: hypothetical protein ACJ72H_23910 [Candidatus Sulfotelmatobacter sp.]
MKRASLALHRREFITLVGAAALMSPLAARAQETGRHMRRISALIGGSTESDPESKARVEVFRQALEQRGWIDGHNVRIKYRWSGADAERIRIDAADLVAGTPDVIFAHATPATLELRRLALNIPVVRVRDSVRSCRRGDRCELRAPR